MKSSSGGLFIFGGILALVLVVWMPDGNGKETTGESDEKSALSDEGVEFEVLPTSLMGLRGD
jgi:hypothetical protein